LAIFGKNVEDAYGPLRYLVFYFAGGFAAMMVRRPGVRPRRPAGRVHPTAHRPLQGFALARGDGPGVWLVEHGEGCCATAWSWTAPGD